MDYNKRHKTKAIFIPGGLKKDILFFWLYMAALRSSASNSSLAVCQANFFRG